MTISQNQEDRIDQNISKLSNLAVEFKFLWFVFGDFKPGGHLPNGEEWEGLGNMMERYGEELGRIKDDLQLIVNDRE